MTKNEKYDEIKKIVLSQSKEVKRIICLALDFDKHSDQYIKKTIESWKASAKNQKELIEEFIEEIVYWLQNYLPIVYEEEIDRLHFLIKKRRLKRLDGTAKSYVYLDILHMSFPSCRSRCSVANSIVNELGVVKGVQFICAVLEYSLSKEGKNET